MTPARLKIAFTTSEMAPYVKVGGLGDVSASLPAALAALGHEVRVFLPWYGAISHRNLHPEAIGVAQQVPLSMAGRDFTFNLFAASPDERTPNLQLMLIQCAPLYERGDRIYTEDGDDHVRWGFFARAVLDSIQRLQWSPDILHANDWTSGLLPALLKRRYSWDRLFNRTATLFTIHNLAHQGRFPLSALTDLDLADWSAELPVMARSEREFNFMRVALAESDHITTVSPSYAREIQTAEFGCGLETVLRTRGADLTGILNGIDERIWHPEHDVHVPQRYSHRSLWKRGVNREALQERLALDPDPSVPVLGLVARLAEQKGIGLLQEVLPRFLEEGRVQLAVLGSGERPFEEFFAGLCDRYPGRAAFARGYDEPLSHQIEAGVDLFLMPSLFEPCGLNQMYSLRYGAVPLVHRTGGLIDTVSRVNDEGTEGNGFVFAPFTAAALQAELSRALRMFEDRPTWEQLQARGMRQSWSWNERAEQYVDLYRGLLR